MYHTIFIIIIYNTKTHNITNLIMENMCLYRRKLDFDTNSTYVIYVCI